MTLQKRRGLQYLGFFTCPRHSFEVFREEFTSAHPNWLASLGQLGLPPLWSPFGVPDQLLTFSAAPSNRAGSQPSNKIPDHVALLTSRTHTRNPDPQRIKNQGQNRQGQGTIN